MVLKVSKTILGEDWFSSFSEFRQNPETYLDKRKLTRDAFCLDVLKELCLDHIETQNKINLLLLLQEHSSLLIKDINLLEQVVGSLINFSNILIKSDKRLLKCQVLVTITTLVLSQNLENHSSHLVSKFNTFLLKSMHQYSEDSAVVSTVCKCLEELEEFYPGILEPEIKNISIAAEQETSPAFQDYVLLLNLCVKHLTINSLNKSSVFEADTEKAHEEGLRITAFVSQILELVPYMTATATNRVIRDLIFIVKHTPQLKPATFKLFLQNCIMSSEVPRFKLAFDLQEAFGSSLFSLQEVKFLLRQLIKLSTHPCITSSHRLLYLDWLKSYVTSKNNNFKSNCEKTDLYTLLPSPFDGPLTQEKKLCVLSFCMPTESKESLIGDLLNESVNGLMKCSIFPGGTKAAPSLFRVLFVYFSSYKTKTIYDAVFRILTRVMKTSPHLTPYALSFLQSVKDSKDDSKLVEEVLDHSVLHILSVPLKQFLNNLEYYLTILQCASHESASICRPRGVLRLFQKLLDDKGFKLNNYWSTGNDILSVCRSFLKYHDVQIFYYDLAEVLCLLTSNSDDADVKDRAKIYYSMLTTLSKSKVQNIFNLNSSDNNAKSPLSTFVAGYDAFQFACIQNLLKPVLQLDRVEPIMETIKSDSDESAISSISNVLESYHNYLSSYESTVVLPFTLKKMENSENNFQELYSLVISTQSVPACKEISMIEIPTLEYSKDGENEGTVVSLKITPIEPYPVTLHFRADFTCDKGYSYSCALSSIALSFQDFFMPLPVPILFESSARSWKQKLFEVLWEHFEESCLRNETNFCESSLCINLEQETFFAIVEKKLKCFIVSKTSDCTCNIAIHLPPANHVLMKLLVVNHKPFVNIIVDNSSTLPWVTLFLQSIGEDIYE